MFYFILLCDTADHNRAYRLTWLTELQCMHLFSFFAEILGRCFYVRKQLLLSARLSHRNSLCSSVCHTGGSVKNGAI